MEGGFEFRLFVSYIDRSFTQHSKFMTLNKANETYKILIIRTKYEMKIIKLLRTNRSTEINGFFFMF